MCARKQVDLTHDYDAKLLKISEELIDIRTQFGAQPRLSRLEDEVTGLKKELQVPPIASSILHIYFTSLIACILSYRNLDPYVLQTHNQHQMVHTIRYYFCPKKMLK